MNKPCFPAPEIAPFHRLHVYDSLMMNAQRWLLAHEYHRRRQNVHYQALNQPGIVCGLGVHLIEPPESADARFRDPRWIEIQPGIAIDVEGNVIVVDPAVDRRYRIAAKAPTIGTLTVYVVVSYVEPEAPIDHQHPETLQEQFRFDQKTTPPAPHEVELCRIQLSPGTVQIQEPTDVLFPQMNQLDLRYRMQAQARSRAMLTIAQVTPLTFSGEDDRTHENLSSLIASVSALYPSLQGNPTVGSVTLQAVSNLSDYDLLYLTGSQLIHSSDTELNTLNQYLSTGGVVLIEAASQQENIPLILDCVTYQLETPLRSWKELDRTHPLRSQPFVFAALPTLHQEAIHFWSGGGVIVIAGELSTSWGADDRYALSRSDIRTAQELGINCLQFAYRRRHLSQLLQSESDQSTFLSV